jgi:hypothetical protein
LRFDAYIPSRNTTLLSGDEIGAEDKGSIVWKRREVQHSMMGGLPGSITIEVILCRVNKIANQGIRCKNNNNPLFRFTSLAAR